MSTVIDEKADWCGFCRSDSHSMCASVKCTCPSKGRRNHPLRKSAKAALDTTGTATQSAPPPTASAPITPLRPVAQARKKPGPKPKAAKPAAPMTKPQVARIANLRLDGDNAALIARALRFTVGGADGGVDTECFEDNERATLLALAETIGGSGR